jgi:hypothetical protein
MLAAEDGFLLNQLRNRGTIGATLLVCRYKHASAMLPLRKYANPNATENQCVQYSEAAKLLDPNRAATPPRARFKRLSKC